METAFSVIAPKRDAYKGFARAGYFFPSEAPTKCVRIDSEADEPARDGVLRIGRVTYARLLAAQSDGRLLIVADQGERAEADADTIKRLSADLASVRAALRDMTARAEVAEGSVAGLRAEIARIGGAVSEARVAETAAVKARDEALAARDEAIRMAAQKPAQSQPAKR